MTDRILSPLAIDLGGRYTGLFMAHYAYGEDPAHGHRKAHIICLPQDGGEMIWSQRGRTSRRHLVRNNKRRKLARRLLSLLLVQALNLQPTRQQWTRLNGYLKRRGYNRLQVEQDLQPLDDCPPDWFAEQLPDIFDSVTPLTTRLDEILQDVEASQSLLNSEVFATPGKREFKGRLPNDMDTWEKARIVDAWAVMRDALLAAQREREGNRHRREYLDNIAHDLARDKLLAPLFASASLEATQMAHLIGHVSNLQLRPLRWYFNDPGMASGDRWDAPRLHRVLRRWVLGLRPEDHEQRNARRRVLDALDKSKENILEFLLNHDPADTIPPYEDQNNRRPPKDQTLWLSPTAMDRLHPNWKLWTAALRRANSDLEDGLSVVTSLTDRRSRPPVNARREALLLQRLMDRSRTLDPYALRLLVTNSDSENARSARNRLSQDLGSQHLDAFLEFAGDYFDEIRLARQGLWQPHDTNLLERADLNPPHKSRILHVLIGNLFGETVDLWSEDRLERFRREAWSKPFKGRSSPRSVATKWVELQKNWGNLLADQLRRLAYRHDELGQKPGEWKKEEKDLWKQRENAFLAIDHIAAWLGHDEKRKTYYANPWTLIQLYNLLEKDSRGFSRTTLAAHIENAWRMTKLRSEDGRESARCSRLSSDTVRPFDGVLRRLLERQASAIARAKLAQILEHADEDCELLVPILVEENRFTFTLGIKELKKQRDGSLERVLSRRREQQDRQWQDKMGRIRAASRNICPYTGETIGEHGEYDHIVPRAASRDRAGTVFNNEANLIWCSHRGNRQKGDKRYTLAQLAPAYLERQFGSADIDTVRAHLQRTITSLPDGFLFQELSEKQQRAVRHALFLDASDPAWQKVIRSLAEQQKARVNGTQAWLARRIITLMGQELDARGIRHRFLVQRVDGRQVHDVRRLLGETLPRFAKRDPQPVSSHAMDALCVLAAAVTDEDMAQRLGLPETLLEDPEWLAKFLPDSIVLDPIQRRPAYRKHNISAQALFNEGIYAERFLPVWIHEGTLHFGFDLDDNILTLDRIHAPFWLERLWPVLRRADGQAPEGSPDSLLQSEQTLRFVIDRDAAFTHLHRVAKEPAEACDLELADLLDGLSYFVQKVELRKVFGDNNAKCKKREDVLKEKDFTVKFDCKLGARGQHGRVAGKLRLPVRDDWKRFLAHLEHRGHFRPGEDLPDADAWQRICADYFRDTGNRDPERKHQGTRRQYSLPRAVWLAGKLFRVRRNTAGGESLWQLLAANGSPSCGFAIRHGKICWNEVVLLPLLAQSPDLVMRGARHAPPAEAIAWFDEWRELPAPEPLEALAMAPGTEGRAYLRLTMSWETFRRWAEPDVTYPFDLPASMKVDAAKFKNAHGLTLLGKPRSGQITIQELGPVVRIQYTVENTTTEMKRAWETASPGAPKT